ncbi:hypothetical protein DESPIG_00159 [Desulfovibrio piger ATCC 29098]|uniref:Uncharacterized protein n=1 Tax=Desulfovibrio piger ATCC 29098 TaxID=411464 RepID=B6WQ36_9BACT|nr:hypothetical protein DESPIG_00159 [Desulfovibrio piger ATCC 29098]
MLQNFLRALDWRGDLHKSSQPVKSPTFSSGLGLGRTHALAELSAAVNMLLAAEIMVPNDCASADVSGPPQCCRRSV